MADEAGLGIDDIRRPYEPVSLGPVVVDIDHVTIDYEVLADRSQGLRQVVTSGFRSRQKRVINH